MWDLPGPGLKHVSPALAGRFLTTAPPGKSNAIAFICLFLCFVSCNLAELLHRQSCHLQLETVLFPFIPLLHWLEMREDFLALFQILGESIHSFTNKYNITYRVFVDSPYQVEAEFYSEVSESFFCPCFVINGFWFCQILFFWYWLIWMCGFSSLVC